MSNPVKHVFGPGAGDQFKAAMLRETSSPWAIGLHGQEIPNVGLIFRMFQNGSDGERGILFPTPALMRAAAEQLLDTAGKWERGEL